MKNAHYEGDAQNNHIVGVELFNSKFNIKTLRTLRIYLNQPSPTWTENTIRSMQMFAKKLEPITNENSQSSAYMRPQSALSSSSGKGPNGNNAFD